MKFIIFLLLLISIPFNAAAGVDNWNVDGENGELYVYGELTEGSCRLDMTSDYQQISLGDIDDSNLRRPGDEGKSVPFILKLRDCMRIGGAQVNRYSGSEVWDALQPVVTISFLAVEDPSMPSLIAASGMSGIALRLRDSAGRIVPVGERAEPQFESVGDNELVYTITPVRTEAPLIDGPYQATINFQVNYE